MRSTRRSIPRSKSANDVCYTPQSVGSFSEHRDGRTRGKGNRGDLWGHDSEDIELITTDEEEAHENANIL